MTTSRVRLVGHPAEVMGSGLRVPLAGGDSAPYVFFDNAATTPPLVAAVEAVNEFLPWYSSVHRGAGLKSRVATAAYEEARFRVGRYVNAAPGQAVIFTKSTTEGLNRVAELARSRGMTVFISIMEHHANLLPWRFSGVAVDYFEADADGTVDEDDLRQKLRMAPAGPRLVAIAGAYNVTGYAPPIHRIAALAHEYGAEILVDGAQLVPHRVVDLRGSSPAESIDYLVFSAHKIYAPFGLGVLVAPTKVLDEIQPSVVGGGIVRLVTRDEVVWSDLPGREEAGSPNVVGAVALGAALERLQELGREQLVEDENALTAYALERFGDIPAVRILGPGPGPNRVGVISFLLQGHTHAQVASALGHEYGIGVRSGCFCAHLGVMHLLNLTAPEADQARARMRLGMLEGVPGAVRVSLGLQNSSAEVDRLMLALRELVANGPRERDECDTTTDEYLPLIASSFPLLSKLLPDNLFG
jgi:cysteine desulfurase / selenocysteine lyase